MESLRPRPLVGCERCRGLAARRTFHLELDHLDVRRPEGEPRRELREAVWHAPSIAEPRGTTA
jgi:hypothetical protein